MRKFYLLAFFLFTICAAPQANAQEFFDDQEGWLAAICGTVIDEDFNQLSGPTNSLLFEDLGDPVDLAFGQVASTDPNSGVFYFNSGEGVSFLSAVDNAIETFVNTDYVFTLDTATHGEFEGFCMCYESQDFNSTVSIELFEGDNLVSTLTLPGVFNAAASINYCWINDTGAAITSFSVIFPDTGLAAICDIDVSFKEPVVVDTCRGQLQDLIADLESLLPTGSAEDDYFILEALLDLNAVDSDAIFDGDLLNENGCYFFFRAQWAMYFLQCVHDSDVSAQIDALNTLVQCVTQAAIDEATNNGGDQSFIDYANDLESHAQYLEDCGYYLDAIYFRKFAWYYAFCS